MIELLDRCVEKDKEKENDPNQKDLFTLNPLQMDDLPEDLVDDLNLSKGDRYEAQILELLQIADRPLAINELIVGLFRKFGEHQKRSSLSARLYRMTNRGFIHAVPHKKGLYALGDGEEEDKKSSESDDD